MSQMWEYNGDKNVIAKFEKAQNNAMLRMSILGAYNYRGFLFLFLITFLIR
jgi:hypothetical protein